MSDVVRIFGPILLWLALFSGVYGLHGLGCGLGWPEARLGGWPLHRTALVAAAGAAVVLQAGALYAVARPLRSDRAFVQGVSLTVAITALVATAWTLAPVVVVTSCR
jgi:hypothetical protein